MGRDGEVIGVDNPGRFWAPYDSREDYRAGMWRRARGSSEVTLIALAVRLLRDTARFRDVLSRVIREWPVSCRVEFTRRGSHEAWMGAAACCLAHGVPEGLTRRAWWKLTDAEQLRANAVAREALLLWEAVDA